MCSSHIWKTLHFYHIPRLPSERRIGRCNCRNQKTQPKFVQSDIHTLSDMDKAVQCDQLNPIEARLTTELSLVVATAFVVLLRSSPIRFSYLDIVTCSESRINTAYNSRRLRNETHTRTPEYSAWFWEISAFSLSNYTTLELICSAGFGKFYDISKNSESRIFD